MKIAFHIGAHFTDDDRLLKCLLKNKGYLAERGVMIPGPGRYRTVIREALIEFRGQPMPPQRQASLLTEILDSEGAARLVLSNSSFLSAPARALSPHGLYPKAGEKAAWLRNLFADHACEFYLSLRNPATFISTLLRRGKSEELTQAVAAIDARGLRWSDMVRNIRSVCPEAPLTVWCNEDTPLTWTEVVNSVAGMAPGTQLGGTYDFLGTLMSAQGMERLRDALKTSPPRTELQRRATVARFLEQYGLEEALEEEVDVPGWSGDLVDGLTAAYDDDCALISQMQDVTFIAP